jgi:putative molybdopterin biosynthesis protein
MGYAARRLEFIIARPDATLGEMETRTRLQEVRKKRAIGAARLAELAQVSRQTIYAIEAGDYVPNTALALQLARILEVKVEDLFELEPDAPPPRTVDVELIASDGAHRPGQPVQLCKVGRRLVGVSAAPQPATLPLADGVIAQAPGKNAQTKIRVFQNDAVEANRLLIAGCDPGMSLLAQHLSRFDNIDLVIAPSSSRQALDWLRRGLVHVAGAHLRDRASGEFNIPAVRRMFPKGGAKMVTFAIWEQGLVMAAGNPKRIRRIADLGRRDVRIVNREVGAGSRELLDAELAAAGIPAGQVAGYERIAQGHLAAAAAVSSGQADCCIATRAAAQAFGLEFVPLSSERYDLVIARAFVKTPAVKALLDALNRASLKKNLEMLAGYDTSHTGQVLLS